MCRPVFTILCHSSTCGSHVQCQSSVRTRNKAMAKKVRKPPPTSALDAAKLGNNVISFFARKLTPYHSIYTIFTPFLSRWALHKSSNCPSLGLYSTVPLYRAGFHFDNRTSLALRSRQRWSQRCSETGGTCKSSLHLLPFYSLSSQRKLREKHQQRYPIRTSVTFPPRNKLHTWQSQPGAPAGSSWSLPKKWSKTRLDAMNPDCLGDQVD